jgi:ABC-2 type transport system ATP-binding protein
VCDSLSIIGKGRLLASGTVSELVGRARSGGVWVGVPDPARAAALLAASPFRVTRDRHHLYVEGVDDPAEITRLLAAEGVYVRELVPDRPDLEQIFLELTGDHGLGGSSGRGRTGDDGPPGDDVLSLDLLFDTPTSGGKR